MTSSEVLKEEVRAFWDEAACGEIYAQGKDLRERLEHQANDRYALEPFIFDFANFPSGGGLDVLEVGVGMGADHLEWARHRPRSLTGIDLTPRAVEFTRERLALYGLPSDVRVGDAENLPFQSESFDIVYSWGVLHHSPDTQKAVNEVFRVLRPNGRALVMIYHRNSVVGALLWIRYALMRGLPLTSMATIYARYMESPGTKAYTTQAAHHLFRKFARVTHRIELSVGDTLEGAAGQRHQGLLLRAAKSVWPRALIKRFAKRYGLFLLITAQKGGNDNRPA
jgi:ubiquinone/menaquinone biosynthesis C-methylase UbiE